MSLVQVLDPLLLRRVFGKFPTGVAAIAALAGEQPIGLAVSSFTSVSLEPPMVLVCVAHTSRTWPTLSQRPRLGVSVLAAGQEQACKQLSARNGDRFEGLAWRSSPEGAVFLEGAGAWFDTSIERVFAAGDHDVVILAVHDVDDEHIVAPLVFHGSKLHRLQMQAPAEVEASDLRASNVHAAKTQQV